MCGAVQRAAGEAGPSDSLCLPSSLPTFILTVAPRAPLARQAPARRACTFPSSMAHVPLILAQSCAPPHPSALLTLTFPPRPYPPCTRNYLHPLATGSQASTSAGGILGTSVDSVPLRMLHLPSLSAAVAWMGSRRQWDTRPTSIIPGVAPQQAGLRPHFVVHAGHGEDGGGSGRDHGHGSSHWPHPRLPHRLTGPFPGPSLAQAADLREARQGGGA